MKALTQTDVEKMLEGYIEKLDGTYFINESAITAATEEISSNSVNIYTMVTDNPLGGKMFVVGDMTKRRVRKPIFAAVVRADQPKKRGRRPNKA